MDDLANAFPFAPTARARRRFIAKIDASDQAGCWMWTASKDHRGYGQFVLGPTPKRAHRVAVLWSGREIPDGYEVDHLCFKKACVNPAHLDIVTHGVNMFRAAMAGAMNRNRRRRRAELPTRSEPRSYCTVVDGDRRLKEALLELLAEIPEMSFDQLHSHVRLTPKWYVRTKLEELKRLGRVAFDGYMVRSSSLSNFVTLIDRSSSTDNPSAGTRS